MKLRYVAALAAAFASAPALSADAASTALLKQALEAQGGEQKLRAIQAVSFEASGYRNMLEQSERPEGPYFVTFQKTSELHDHAHQALRRQQVLSAPASQDYVTTSVVANKMAMQAFGSRQFPGTARDVQVALENLALAPERVLVTALDAADAHREPDTVLQGVPHQVVAFTFDGAPARIYLNQDTHLPTAVDYAGPAAREGYAAYLGDVTLRTLWGFWRLDKSGLRYPMQWDVQLNGMPSHMLRLDALKVDAPLDPAATAIPAEVAARFLPDAPARLPDNAKLGKDQSEIAPGIVQIRGSWDVAIVDQGDGLVVIEAPISSGYSAQVLLEAARRYPGKPVKAVVSTSDSWPHLAGIREYAAHGIPVYALDRSEPIVRRTLAASYASHPDTLQKVPRQPIVRLVSGKTLIGSGPNRIELYPMRGETSERQVMAWFPGQRLLYGSDPFQRKQGGGYSDPQAVSELVRAAAREHLDPDRFFMMHLEPTPYSELLAVGGSED